MLGRYARVRIRGMSRMPSRRRMKPESARSKPGYVGPKLVGWNPLVEPR